MAISLKDIRTNNPSDHAPRIVIVGPEGIGKSTFGANAPDPVFIWTEKGHGVLDVQSFPLVKTYDEFMECLGALAEEDHTHKTLQIDSVDWLEPLVHQETCRRNKWTDIESAGYGKGYIATLEVWAEVFEALDFLNTEKKIMIVIAAHAAIVKFSNPETESYDRYDIKLHKLAAAKLKEWADIVLFANNKVSIAKEDEGFNKERKRAVGGTTRYLYTQDRAAANAKNRYGLPESIPFDKDGAYWNVFFQHIPYLQNLYKPTEESKESN